MDQGLTLWLYVEFRQLTIPEQMYAYLDRLFSHFANRYSIQNVRNGRYILKQRMLSPENGSVQDLLRQMGATEGVYVHSHDPGTLSEGENPP